MIPERPPCRKCSEIKPVKLRRQFAGNGAMQIFWFCTVCGCNATSSFIKRSDAAMLLIQYGAGIEDIEVLADYRHESPKCIVCGDIGTEYHHWLPQAFMERVDNHGAWPGDHLCKKHHDQWHELVTPYLPGRGRTDDAQYTKEKYLWLEQTT